MSRIKLLNLEIDNVNMKEALDNIEELIIKRDNSYVVTPNVDHIVRLESDTEFVKIYNEADLILADGMPLIWMSKLLKTPLKEKVSGSDLFPLLCEIASKKGYKVFLLGAAEGVAVKATENLKNKYENLQVVGCYSPSYGFENDKKELDYIINIINSVKPDILVVGLGSPKQEKFIYKYRNKLNVPISLALGASIDFEAGNVKRAPKWMQKIGLEWFYRLLKEPKRMYKRYLIDDIKIVKIFFKYKDKRENNIR